MSVFGADDDEACGGAAERREGGCRVQCGETKT